MADLTWNDDRTWVSDINGNRCSVAYWGSEAAAEVALRSLKDCSDCSGCSGCSDCSDCSDCSGKTENATPEIPRIENIDQAVYAAASAPNALEMSRWHTCGTTHCRAGWVVHLAGEAGYALERHFNTELAAMLIYRESGSPISPMRFYDSNADALEDMRRRAEAA